MTLLRKWSGSLHKSFRLLPTGQHGNDDLLAFLNTPDGGHWREIHERLPYDSSRAGTDSDDDDDDDGQGAPNAKRYRDLKQVLETCGLLWQDDDGYVWFTDFGRTLKRFINHANEHNMILLSQHAAFALSVCQLRNPTGAGRRYAPEMEVFPFRFIWQAMLRLDHRISSDELNCAIFHTQNSDMLEDAIQRIQLSRRGHPDTLFEYAISGRSRNDRIIPIVALASFGWTILTQKDEQGFYNIRPECIRLLEATISLPSQHRDYASVQAYVQAISNAACLPKDCR